MLKSEVPDEVKRLLDKRAMMGKSYHVSSVESVHCVEDLLYWRYCDQLHWLYRLQNCKYLSDILMDVSIPVTSTRLFHFIGGSVIHNNIAIIDKEEGMMLCDVQRTAFKEALNRLVKGELITVHENKMDKRGTLLISVAPASYWNGCYITRNAYLKDWYTGKGDRGWLK